MSQNIVSLTLTDAQITASAAALTALETQLAGLIALDPARRRELFKMGDKSEVFCRQAIGALSRNPQIVPPSLGLADAQADVLALDRLRPLLERLQRLVERAQDTEMALGSDIISTALEGYSLLKTSGKNQGLDGLRKELSARFAKAPRSTDAAPA